MLDANGRCCGKKPLQYRSNRQIVGGPLQYCPRCDRAYDLDTGEQIDNWAWRWCGLQWERQTNKQETA